MTKLTNPIIPPTSKRETIKHRQPFSINQSQFKALFNIIIYSLFLKLVCAKPIFSYSINRLDPNFECKPNSTLTCLYNSNFEKDTCYPVASKIFIDLSPEGNFTGCFDNGEFNGLGIYEWSNGTRFEGDFKQSKIHKGVLFNFNTLEAHQGEFIDNKLNGIGLLFKLNKTHTPHTMHFGQFDQGKLIQTFITCNEDKCYQKPSYLLNHGKDILIERHYKKLMYKSTSLKKEKCFYNPNEFYIDIKNDYSNDQYKQRYSGKINSLSIREGFGHLDESLLDEHLYGHYLGCFKNGVKDGYGIYKWPNGETFTGFWKNNEMYYGNYKKPRDNEFHISQGFFKSNQLDGVVFDFFGVNKTTYLARQLIVNEYKNNEVKHLLMCLEDKCHFRTTQSDILEINKHNSFIIFYKFGFLSLLIFLKFFHSQFNKKIKVVQDKQLDDFGEKLKRYNQKRLDDSFGSLEGCLNPYYEENKKMLDTELSDDQFGKIIQESLECIISKSPLFFPIEFDDSKIGKRTSNLDSLVDFWISKKMICDISNKKRNLTEFRFNKVKETQLKDFLTEHKIEINS